MNSTKSANERDEKLMRLWGELTAAVVQRGLAHARSDDPNSYAVANRMLQSPGATMQLRISFTKESASTVGYVIDEGGEPLARVFEITATVQPQH
jgi:hypothetical protein